MHRICRIGWEHCRSREWHSRNSSNSTKVMLSLFLFIWRMYFTFTLILINMARGNSALIKIVICTHFLCKCYRKYTIIWPVAHICASEISRYSFGYSVFKWKSIRASVLWEMKIQSRIISGPCWNKIVPRCINISDIFHIYCCHYSNLSIKYVNGNHIFVLCVICNVRKTNSRLYDEGRVYWWRQFV